MTDTNESRPTEVGAPKTRIMTAKSKTRIGYWNVRALCDSSRLAQLTKEMENYKINILGLSEVRWTDSGKFKSGGNKTIRFSGTQDNTHRGVVAAILDKKTQKVRLQNGPQ